MGLTRTNIASKAFTQPALDGTIILQLDPGVDWLRDGALVKIENAGIYKILSHSDFSFTLQLKRAIAADGSAIGASVVHPVAGSFGELVDSPLGGFATMAQKVVFVGADETRLEYGEEGEIGDFPDYSSQLNNLLNF